MKCSLSICNLVQAVNRAGLSSGYIYLDFSADHSPPTAGHVMDGISPDVNVCLPSYPDNMSLILTIEKKCESVIFIFISNKNNDYK